ncbi:type I methionyl aminopeptidase [Cohnella sp. GCM10027633]|uniref:type I methionyl aminopeptidase n=1 Tax=unclassified Cohnella TaxID=2636738 RepID=UPI00362EC9F9
MTVGSEEDVAGLKAIGKIVALTIRTMKEQARAGMTTRELDEIGAKVLLNHGAEAAPKLLYGFPGYACISVGRDIAHGIPGDRKLRPGDLINIDVSAVKDGYYADSGHSFQLPPYDTQLSELCRYTHDTMMKVIASLRHGVKLNEVGRIIQEEAKRGGYKVIHNLCSHGIGRALHEAPTEVLPVYNKHDKRVLKEGMVLTIEPFLSTGAEIAVEQNDGWTLSLPDHSHAAQHEHTIIVTRDRPIILTVA